MSCDRKIVLVTGSNKGIGYGIIETLLEKKSNLKIILTSRNEDLGKILQEIIILISILKRLFLLSSIRYYQ